MISEMPMQVVFLWNQPAKDFVCCILTIKFHHGNYNDFYTHNLLMKTFRSEKKKELSFVWKVIRFHPVIFDEI